MKALGKILERMRFESAYRWISVQGCLYVPRLMQAQSLHRLHVPL